MTKCRDNGIVVSAGRHVKEHYKLQTTVKLITGAPDRRIRGQLACNQRVIGARVPHQGGFNGMRGQISGAIKGIPGICV